MTLPTNASAAAFGSALTCLNNTNNQPTDTFAMTTTGWASEPLKCIGVARPGSSVITELGVYAANTYYDRAGNPWFASTDQSGTTWYGMNSLPSGTNKYLQKSSGSGYTYIYVGPTDGKRWGIDPKYKSMGGVVPYGSCYVSLVGV